MPISIPDDIIRDRVLTRGPAGPVVGGEAITDILTRLAALEGLAIPVTRGIVSGYYYGPLTTLSGYTDSGIYVVANALVASPFVNPATATFNQIGVEVVSAAGTGGTIRLGIYGIGADGLPANLITELGTVDTTATGYRPSPAISLTLPRGLYWIAGAANQLVSIKHVNGTGMTAVLGQAGTTGHQPTSAVSRTLTSGFSSLPATFGAPSASIWVPAFQLRAV